MSDQQAEPSELEVQRAIGREMVALNDRMAKIHTAVVLTAIFTLVTALFVAAWLLGLITIEFRPQQP